MLVSPRLRAVGLLTGALIVTGFVSPSRRAPGMTYEMVSTTTSSMSPAGNTTMTARGSVAANGATRLEIVTVVGAAAAAYAVGDYFLTTGGQSMLVRPSSKTYLNVMDQAMSALNNMPPELLAQLSLTGLAGTTEKLADSEPIEGRPTEHYHTTIAYSMNMMGQAIPTTIVSDYWITKLPVAFANPLSGGVKASITSGPMAELMQKQIDLAPPASAGIAIKSTTVQSVSMMGQSIVTTTTSEMKNVKEADVDAATFVLPAGYMKVEK